MTRITEWLMYVYLFIVAVSSMYFAAKVHNMPPKPACAVAEISPDVSLEDKARCRRARGHKL
jgi:hypothetical protein